MTCINCGKEWDVIGTFVDRGGSICDPCWQREQALEDVCRKWKYLNDMCQHVHTMNKQWWEDINTGEPLQRNVGEMLMLTVSELAEAMEGHRKNLMDDHLPHRKMFEVELADAVIRIFDIAAGLGYDLGAAFNEKMQYNAKRADHKKEARLKADGKKY